MKRRTLFVLAAGSVAALAVTGTALGAAARDVVPPAPTTSATTSATTPAAAPAEGPDRRRAGELALAHVGGGRVVEIERELEHGRAVWSVKVVKDGVRHEVHVDVATGAVVRDSTSDDRGGRRAERTTDDHGYDDHGGRRPDTATDDRGYDDHGGRRAETATDDRGHDDKGGDRRGGRDDG